VRRTARDYSNQVAPARRGRYNGPNITNRRQPLSLLAPAGLAAPSPIARARAHALELWRYRELVRNFVVRDLKARYKNSVLGFLWSLANPLLMMIVFTIVFTKLFPTTRENFPLFLLSGQLAWAWCTSSVTGGVFSITGNPHLIKKVYFPRELLPLSIVLSNGVNFLLTLIPLVVIAIASGRPPNYLVLLLPVVMIIQFVFLTGLALFFGCLNVFFRDTEPIMDVLILAWFFLTPIFYSLEDFNSPNTRLLYILNPMASIISTYRLIFYYQSPPDAAFVLRMAAQALLVFVIGYWFFRRHAADFGEEV
jgi:lipopolysaccharide transport system permease protein